MCTTFTLSFFRPHTCETYLPPFHLGGGRGSYKFGVSRDVLLRVWKWYCHPCLWHAPEAFTLNTPSGIFHLILSFPPRFFALSFSFPPPCPLISLFLLRFISYSFFPSFSFAHFFFSLSFPVCSFSSSLFHISHLSVFFQLSFYRTILTIVQYLSHLLSLTLPLSINTLFISPCIALSSSLSFMSFNISSCFSNI